jgi:hypothetical protein
MGELRGRGDNPEAAASSNGAVGPQVIPIAVVY